MQVKSDAVQRSWENAEFPILCEGMLVVKSVVVIECADLFCSQAALEITPT